MYYFELILLSKTIPDSPTDEPSGRVNEFLRNLYDFILSPKSILNLISY